MFMEQPSNDQALAPSIPVVSSSLAESREELKEEMKAKPEMPESFIKVHPKQVGIFKEEVIGEKAQQAPFLVA